MSHASQVITVFGMKGGVGKSLVAANLATALVDPKTKVALLDFDVMALGDLGRIFKLPPKQGLVELTAHLVSRTAPPLDLAAVSAYATHHASGVDVYACVTSPAQARHLKPELIHPIIQSLRSLYDFIVIDAGRALTDTWLVSLEQANLVLLVLTPDLISLHQAQWTLGLMDAFLLPSQMTKLVVNRSGSRGSVGVDDVKGAIAREVFSEVPSDGRVVGLSVNQGAPLVISYPQSRVATAFRTMAQQMKSGPQLFIPQIFPKECAVPDGEGMLQTSSMPLKMLPPEATIAPQAAVPSNAMADIKRQVHEQLVEQMDLKRVDLAALAGTDQAKAFRKKMEGVIADLLARFAGGVFATLEVRQRLVKEIADEALGLGPLEDLLVDADITDILVNSKDQIYVERHGRLELTDRFFLSDDQLRAAIERIVAPLGRRIDESTPMVDARLPDGSRVNAIIPPLSVKGPILSIRKFSRERLNLNDLVKLHSLTPDMGAFLQACVEARKNIIISGGTGSGKTTLLNVVSAFIPASDRILTIEDAAELRLSQMHWVSLEARPPNVEGRGQVTIRDLFRNALRMRPDRIIIGECRGAETLDMLQAMNTGHDGSLTTVHANSAKDVMTRLDSMVLMSDIELPLKAIREMVASSIHLIVHTARLSDGSRKVTSIQEITGIQGVDIQLAELFRFHQTGVNEADHVEGFFEATGLKPSFYDALRARGIHLAESVFTSVRV